MATTASGRTPAKRPATLDRQRADAALERLSASLDAAQDAAKALRKDVRRGTRDMARDVEKLIAATRKDSAKLAKAVRADLAELQKAVVSPPARSRAKTGPSRARAPKPAAKKAPARK